MVDSGRFLDARGRKAVLESIRESIEAEGLVSWDELLAAVKTTWDMVRMSYVAARPDQKFGAAERLRLSDGKSVVKKLANMAGSNSGKWANHLLEDAKKTAFATQFREELLAITRAVA